MRQIVLNRIDKSGVAEPQVVVQGNDRIVVEMPGVTNVDQIRDLVGTTGRLDFVPLGSTPAAAGQKLDPAWIAQPCSAEVTINCVLFSGDQVSSAAIGADQTGQRTVDFTLGDEGKQKFADFTAANIGTYFAIVLDGEVISAPVIQDSIPNGQVQISQGGIGGYPLQEAQNLVTILEFGQLPFPIAELANTTVSPTLGDKFLTQMLLGGAIAILMVMFFMIVHYRLPGVVASGALIFYTLIVYALFRLIPVTMTLAGIAGFVLSVGMAVDANILIFERMKEELRLGKTPAVGGRGRLQPGLELDPRLQRVEPDHRDDPVPVRVVDDPRLRARADDRRAGVDVHRDHGHPLRAADRGRPAVGPQGVPVRGQRRGLPGPASLRPRRPRRGARTCLTSSASATGSSPSRCSSRSRA